MGGAGHLDAEVELQAPRAGGEIVEHELVHPAFTVMNDDELAALIDDHYLGEAQTLTLLTADGQRRDGEQGECEHPSRLAVLSLVRGLLGRALGGEGALALDQVGQFVVVTLMEDDPAGEPLLQPREELLVACFSRAQRDDAQPGLLAEGAQHVAPTQHTDQAPVFQHRVTVIVLLEEPHRDVERRSTPALE